MKTSILVYLGVLVIVVALIFTSVAPTPSAIAAPEVAQDLTVTKNISKAEQDAALAFWTKDAMANAEAMVMPVDFGPSGVDAFAMGQEEALGTPGLQFCRSCSSKCKCYCQEGLSERMGEHRTNCSCR